jgi:inosose dehydratase
MNDWLVGICPIVFNSTDDPSLGPPVAPATVMDEVARIGFSGTQLGRGFPEADALRRELDRRGLRLAELYSALPSSPDGLTDAAADLARRDLARLVVAGGETLVVAVHGSPERDRWSARVVDAPQAPRWPRRAFEELAALLGELAEGAAPDGVRVAFHPHTATWVEAPDEVDALLGAMEADGRGAGLCLDVGHYLVGGGDPVEGLGRFGERVTHVHAKDVDGDVLRRLRGGEIDGFGAAVRERIFTELGNGILDLDGVLRGLADAGFDGWLMVEQDSSWLPPAEASALGYRALAEALARLEASVS